MFPQRNHHNIDTGPAAAEQRERLAARLAALPRSPGAGLIGGSMPPDMEARVRARLDSAWVAGIKGSKPHAFSSASVLGSLPAATQIAVALVLCSLAGWLVLRDVNAYASPEGLSAVAPAFVTGHRGMSVEDRCALPFIDGRKRPSTPSVREPAGAALQNPAPPMTAPATRL